MACCAYAYECVSSSLELLLHRHEQEVAAVLRVLELLFFRQVSTVERQSLVQVWRFDQLAIFYQVFVIVVPLF